ncbi:Trigger factor [Mycoplasmopsis californica]|nr:Trigger factor [Mycoplasmopsis californica]
MINIDKKNQTATIKIVADEGKWSETIKNVESFLKSLNHEVKDVKKEVWNPAVQIYLQENAEAIIKNYEKKNKIILIESDIFKTPKISESELEIELSFVYYDQDTKLKLKHETTLEKINPLFVRLNAEQELKQLLASHTKEKEVKRKAKNGDFMTFDFVGKIDGKPFENGSANDYELQLGSKQFIASLESQLVGLKKGDNVDLDVTFPDNYHAKELAGKKTVFNINVKKVATKEQPKLDDEFVKSLEMGTNTVKELQDKLSRKHELSLEMRTKNQFFEQCLLELQEKNKIKMSDQLVNFVKENIKQKALA